MAVLGFLIMAFCLGWLWLIWRREYRGAVILTPLLLFAIQEIVFIWPATGFSLIEGMYRDGYFVLVIGLCFFFFLLGFSAFRKYQGMSLEFRARKIILLENEPARIMGLFFLFCLLIGSGLYQFQGLPLIFKTLTSFFSGGFDAAAIANETQANRLAHTLGAWFGQEYRGQGVIREIAKLGWPFIILSCAIFYTKTRKKLWLAATVFLLFPAFLFIAGDGQRAPFLWALVIMIIGLSYLRRFTFKAGGLALVTLFMFLMLLSFTSAKAVRYLESEENPIMAVAPKLFFRIFLGNGQNNFRTIDLIRSGVVEHRYGRAHVEKIVSSIPGVRMGTPFAHELYRIINPGGKGTTVYTSSYLSMLYLDFGLIGAMVGYLFMGAIAGWSYRLLYNRRCTHESLLMVTFFSYLLGKMSQTGPIGVGPSAVILATLFMVYKAGVIFHKSMAKAHGLGYRPMPSRVVNKPTTVE